MHSHDSPYNTFHRHHGAAEAGITRVHHVPSPNPQQAVDHVDGVASDQDDILDPRGNARTLHERNIPEPNRRMH